MRFFLGLLFILLFSAFFNAQSGQVFDQLTLDSEILNSKRKYAIYLPPGYESSKRDYPVLYLLHGAGDDHTGWVQYGEVLQIADKEITLGNSTSMIIVMPDAQTGKKGYFNSFSEKWNYENYFFNEFIPFIEEKYRVKSEKKYRAIAGLSMGGGGSFVYALHHPEMFASACPLSAYLGKLDFNSFYASFLKNQKDVNQERLLDYFNNHNVISLITNGDIQKINSVRWYIDCGDDDYLFEGNSLVHLSMRKRNIKHEYRVRDGKHNWTYWRASLSDVLIFVSKGFRGS
jgi:enterochelin esterase-like enzyme